MNFSSIAKVLIFFGICQSPLFLIAQQKSELRIDEIMRGEAFVGYAPEGIQWSDDSKQIYFSWKPTGGLLRDYYTVQAEKGKNQSPRKLDNAELQNLPASDIVYNKLRTLSVYSKNGDLFLQNLSDNSILQITNTLEAEFEPVFLKDESIIAYRSGMNLFIWNSKTGQTEQLTDFRKGNDRKEPAANEQDKWLENDQEPYFQVLKQRKELADARKARQDKQKIKRPKTIYIGESDLFSLKVTPDGRYVLYTTVSRPKNKQTIVADYVTRSGYTSPINAREKVGAEDEVYTAKIYDKEIDSTYALKIEQIAGIYDKPAFLAEYNKKDTAYKSLWDLPRAVIWHGPYFSTLEGAAVYDVKSFDNKDRWLLAVDLQTGNLKTLDRQHDDAWVGGPGIEGWKGVAGNCGWIPDSDWFWFQSEASGWSHLYKINIKTLEKKTLTSGKWELIDAFLSKDAKHFYLTTSEVDPGERHFYKMSIDGGERVKITTLTGNNEVSLSPDEKWLAIRYSYSNKPWELYIQANEPKATPLQITDSRTEQFKKYNWREPELVYFTASDGAQVRARLYRPANAKKGGSAVIFVHGAGYLQNVHKWWSTYHREYMFHNLLADNGYTVLDIDYRASSGYGRDWRTGIYRHMGGKDLSDQVDGAKFLKEKYGIAADRIGIYGGSYGGFITLMAMFNAPDVFKAGAALRSVTDWAHYNHPYTSNILNNPIEDSIAYHRSSPIYFAEGLKGRLLILHGMVDDNVQFQDVVRLSQRLIELGKENWEMAVFPMEAHGFVEASSWTDEYKRIFKLFEETIGSRRP